MNIPEYENYHEMKAHTQVPFPYNTYLCTIPLDFPGVPFHWHEEMELIVIKKGRGFVSVDLESRPVKSGELVVVSPGQLHAIHQDGAYEMEYENILFKPEMLFALLPDVCTVDYFMPFVNGQRKVPVWIDGECVCGEQIFSCVSRIDEICSQKPAGYQIAVKGYLYQLFFLLFQQGGEVDQEKRERFKSLDKLKLIMKKIETDYQENLTVGEMAELSGFSQSHFMKFFKANMGTSFIEYLNEYRLSMAARLLITSSMDILHIAVDTGFSNISYFNRIFKKKFGMTPGQYRKSKSALERV